MLLTAALAVVTADVGDDRDARLLSLVDGVDPSRVTASPFNFYRAALPIFLSDWLDPGTGLARSRFDDRHARPFSVGDPHVENFGTLVGRDGRVTFEANDLDCAGPASYLWDLRRLSVGLCLAAPRNGRELARAAALAYADGLAGAPPPNNGAVVDELLTRTQRAVRRREELDDFTVLDGSARRFRRGSIDRNDPGKRLEDVGAPVRDATAELMTSYRATLVEPRDEAFFAVLDVVRALGRGTASLGRVRLLLLLRGPTDDPGDDVIVELKELVDAPMPQPQPDPVARVIAARRALWTHADADPLWGATTWRGCPVQVRAEVDASRGLRVTKLRGPLGEPAALRDLARTLGARLAAIHRRSFAGAVTADRDAFADEQADVAIRYAERVTGDWQRLRRLVRRRPRSAPAVDSAGPCAWLAR